MLPADNPQPPPIPRTGGRGALFQKLREQQALRAAAETPSTSSVSVPPAEPAPVPKAVGRGQLYKNLLE